MTTQLIQGDCLEVMKDFESASIDLVITSPPYNLRGPDSLTGGRNKSNEFIPLAFEGYESHGDDMPHAEYVEWQRECLDEMFRLIKDDGAIFYNHKWRIQRGRLDDRSDIIDGFPVRQIIIWDKTSAPFPRPSFWAQTYEVIYMIAKPGFRLARDYMNGSVWRIPSHFVKSNNGTGHVAPFPVALPERIIRATDAQVILDPFIGSGTTAVAAERCGRECIGIDISGAYIEEARERLKTVQQAMI